MAYLDNNGLLYLWNKIKGTFVKQESGKGLSTNDYTTMEKKKLEMIAERAEVNQNAFSNVKVGSTTVAADSKTDTLELVAGSNVTLTPDATNDKVTIAAKDTVYTHPTYTAKASGLYKVTVDGTGHVSATTAVAKSDITALGIPGQDTVYTHPTGDGNKHVPATGTTNNGKFLMAGSTAGALAWGTPIDTKYDDFKGTDGTNPGVRGLVPAPAKTASGAFLSSKGEWKNILIHCMDQGSGYLDLYLMVDGTALSTTHIPAADSNQMGVLSSTLYDKLTALPTAAVLSSTYAKKSDIVGMYKYKGSVTDASKLPTTGQITGDVYNIETASAYGGAGMNVAWNGSAWDPLGEIFTITSITNAQIDTICV